MSGYCGYSMSNNAIAAYNSGEKPMSKWTKVTILEEIKCAIGEGLVLQVSLEGLAQLPATELKARFLFQSSWHHTSSYYNETNFYALDWDSLEKVTEEQIKSWKSTAKAKRQAKKQEEARWECSFLEWSGSRKHPKATRITEEGVIKGNWFYRKDGSKKKTTANGFEFVRRLD